PGYLSRLHLGHIEAEVELAHWGALGEVELRQVHPEGVGRYRRFHVVVQALLVRDHTPAGRREVRRTGDADPVGHGGVADDAEDRGGGDRRVVALLGHVDIGAGANETVGGAGGAGQELARIHALPVVD